MKKTILFLLSITFFTAINSMAPFGPIPSGGPGGKFDFPPPPSPEELDKILNSDEFKKALEELEEIFGEMNEDDFKPPQKIEKPKFPEKKSDKKAEKIETLEEKFKNPAQAEEGEQLVKTLSKEKLQAFNYFMDQFENQLQALETKINNFSLGIAFKEELEDLQIGPQKQNYKTITGKIKTEKGIIGSRSLYLKAFYLPSFSEMRKEIIDTVKEVTNINKQIKSVENINEEDQGDKQRKIRPKVKKLFTQKLAQIGDDLKKVATCTQAKAEIERKKQEKEKLGKEAAAKRAKLSKKPYKSFGRGGARPFGAPYGGPSGRPDRWYSKTHTPKTHAPVFGKDKKYEKPKKPKDKKTSTEKAKSFDGISKDRDQRNIIPKMINLTNNLVKKLQQVTKEYKNNFTSNQQTKYQVDILQTNLMTEIDSLLEERNRTIMELSEWEEKRLAESKKYKELNLDVSLKEAIKAFITLAITEDNDATNPQRNKAKKILQTLTSWPGIEKEAKAAIAAIKKSEEKQEAAKKKTEEE